jgi:hypothetical protein
MDAGLIFILMVLLYISLPTILTVGTIVAVRLALAKKRPAQPPAPEPEPEPAPLPDYVPRWTRARILREWQDLARFQQELNG